MIRWKIKKNEDFSLQRRLDILRAKKFLKQGGSMLLEMDVFLGYATHTFEDWMHQLEFNEVK